MHYDGGYYLHSRDLVRTGLNRHSNDLDKPISDETLQAINTLQDVPWRINTSILSTMQEVWLISAPIAQMPEADARALPEKLPDDLWAAMTADEKKVHKDKLSAIHTHNARAESKRHAWLARLQMASDVAEEPAIWFPWFADFRGRLYPQVEALSPQGDDASKALLMFARGKPLGEDGMAWLCVRAANCFGKDGGQDLDKLDLDARVSWTMSNLARICLCVADPLGDLWWSNAEEPWSFLATCFELAAAAEEGPNFVSHLSVPLDGSCNGLQHLAAMGLDSVGAMAVNVIPGNSRRDIYSEIAADVVSRITADAGKGVPEAQALLGRVNRKTVKRGVMTTPYGVTPRGMRDQLIRDDKKGALLGDVPFEERGKAADYLRDCMAPAIEAKVPAAKQVMAWFQAVAGVLADHDIPFRWQTPTGNQLQASYYDYTQKRVQTLAGTIALQVETKEAGLRKSKQKLSAAPHVIHSFDAAHMVRTINACVDAGIEDFAMIHDSFGVHACDTPALSYVLREQFARIYRDNWLQNIEDYIKGYTEGRCEIPSWDEYVTLGDLDVDQVVDSTFFFA